MITAVDCTIIKTNNDINSNFLVQYLCTFKYFNEVEQFLAGGTRQRISRGNLSNIEIPCTSLDEQNKIAILLNDFDKLITLHQRKHRKCDPMTTPTDRKELFYNYYARWIAIYKDGAIRPVTVSK